MARIVVWQEDATVNFEKTVAYLVEDWGKKVAREFYDEVHDNINLIIQFPQSGKATSKKRRKYKRVIRRRTSIIYQFTNDTIYITDVWDNRRKPK
jgi:plasmid stabilization system protein ParE